MEQITYSYGHIREDGHIFRGVVRKRNSKGEYTGALKEVWLSPAAFQRDRVQAAVRNCSNTARKFGLSYELTVEYMLSIFPKDGLCPILGIPMQWGAESGLNCSPSIDKITPLKGYVPGNVAWISLKANRMKQDSTLEELERILAYVRSTNIAPTLHPTV